MDRLNLSQPKSGKDIVLIESDPHVLMMESIIECSLELFFISTTCIFSSDEKGKIRGSISRRMRGSI